MKEIFLIDPLEKLMIKKDSTLLWISTAQAAGKEVYVAFENEFGLSNTEKPHRLKVHKVEGKFNPETFYVDSFEIKESLWMELGADTTIHMRLDPPFDVRYLRTLWLLRFLEEGGTKVVNNPKGILLHNEKLAAYSREATIPSYIGASLEGALSFSDSLKEEQLILKPLDLYQGIGIIKIAKKDLKEHFNKLVTDYKGAIVVQPFVEKITEGEVRAVYYQGREIGSILKTPKAGEFLANIAQGAKYEAYTLSDTIKKECDQVAKELLQDGIDLIAYDILDDKLSEVNVTCPGLLVEVSSANKRNLCLEFLTK